MNNQVQKSKILIAVFREFGIAITGSKKLQRFYSDIPVDRFYVEGILFELESRLGILLEDNERYNSPLDVILAFQSKFPN